MDNTFRIEAISKALNAQLTPQFLEVIDESHRHIGHAGAKDGAGHFRVRIASDAFVGKTLIQCHRLVYDAVQDLIPKEIHALQIEITREI